MVLICKYYLCFQNNGAQQLASEASVYILLKDVNDEIPLFIEQEQGSVLEEMPIGTKVTKIQAIDKDGTYPNNKVSLILVYVLYMHHFFGHFQQNI